MKPDMHAANPSVPAAAQPAANENASRRSWWSLVREDARCVLERDPAARSLLEVWTIYPGVQAIALHRLAHALWQRGWRYGPRWISFMSRWLTNVDIHPGARIGMRFFIDHGAGVVVGETAEIGHDVTIYHGVTLGGTSWSAGKRHPTLGNQVVVGAGAKILGPIQVGNRARIAANSVVIEEVPAGVTVVGIPGRVVTPRRATTHGFDLDHHLIPDPVGKAISCLLDRVAQLERQLQTQTQLQAHTQVPNQAQVQAQAQTQNQASAPVLSTPGAACGACNDHCAEPGFDSLLQPSTPE